MDIKRSLLSPALWLVYSALAGWGISYGPSWALVPIIYSTFFFPVLTSWWFTSVRLSEEIPSEKAVWRNPPLCKPGNKRCPNCGSQVKPNTVWYFRPIRRCTRCGAGLRQDKGRAIIGLAIVGTQMASGCLLTSLGRSHEPPMRFWIDLPLAVYMLLLGAAWQWWFVSVTLDGKAALKPGSP